MPFNRFVAIGFVLVLIGAVLPFLIVLRYVPSTFTLNFLAYGTSTVGIFLAVIGVPCTSVIRARVSATSGTTINELSTDSE